MRSWLEHHLPKLGAVVLLTSALALATPAGAQADAASAPASAPTASAASAPVTLAVVRAATRAMDDDALLNGKEKRQTLSWDFKLKPDKPEKPTPAPPWLRSLAEWLANTGRWVIWLVGMALVAVACVGGWRLWQRRMPLPPVLPLAPSHVGSLDIRPESLPEPVGPAVAAMWHQGDARAALALLYRAALSRLVHQHQVPIRAASTEAECQALAATRLSPEAADGLARLVSAWLEIGYAHRQPNEAVVLDLCARFDALFGASQVPGRPLPLGETFNGAVAA